MTIFDDFINANKKSGRRLTTAFGHLSDFKPIIDPEEFGTSVDVQGFKKAIQERSHERAAENSSGSSSENTLLPEIYPEIMPTFFGRPIAEEERERFLRSHEYALQKDREGNSRRGNDYNVSQDGKVVYENANRPFAGRWWEGTETNADQDENGFPIIDNGYQEIDPYGLPSYGPVNALVQEMNKQNIHGVPANIQSTIAAGIREQYVEQFKAYKAQGGQLNFQQYYDVANAENGTSYALARPLDFSLLTDKTVTVNGTQQTIGEAVPGLDGIHNVQQAQDFLIKSVFSGFANVADPNRSGRILSNDFTQNVSDLSISALEAFRDYTPLRLINGQLKTSSFPNFIASRAIYGALAAQRTRNGVGQPQPLSLEALANEEGDIPGAGEIIYGPSKPVFHDADEQAQDVARLWHLANPTMYNKTNFTGTALENNGDLSQNEAALENIFAGQDTKTDEGGGIGMIPGDIIDPAMASILTENGELGYLNNIYNRILGGLAQSPNDLSTMAFTARIDTNKAFWMGGVQDGTWQAIGRSSRGVKVGTYLGDEMDLTRRLARVFPDEATRAAVMITGTGDPAKIADWQSKIAAIGNSLGISGVPSDPVAFKQFYGKLMGVDPETAAHFTPYMATHAQILRSLKTHQAAQMPQLPPEIAGSAAQAANEVGTVALQNYQDLSAGDVVQDFNAHIHAIVSAKMAEFNASTPQLQTSESPTGPAFPNGTPTEDETDTYDFTQGGSISNSLYSYGGMRSAAGRIPDLQAQAADDATWNKYVTGGVSHIRGMVVSGNSSGHALSEEQLSKIIGDTFPALPTGKRGQLGQAIIGKVATDRQGRQQDAIGSNSQNLNRQEQRIIQGALDGTDPFAGDPNSYDGNDSSSFNGKGYANALLAGVGSTLSPRGTRVDNVGAIHTNPDATGVDSVLYGNAPAETNRKAHDFLTQAISKAGSGPLSDDPETASATMSERVYHSLNDIVKDYADGLTKAGKDPATASGIADGVKNVAKAIFSSIQDSVQDTHSGVTAEGLAHGSTVARANVDVDTPEKLNALLDKNPGIEAAINKAGFTRDNILGRSKDNLVSIPGTANGGEGGDDGSTPASYSFFSGNGSGGGGGGRGMWSGPVGKFMYGAYLAKRMWNMGAEQSMQESSQYSQYMSSFANDTMYGTNGQGYLGTEAASESRQALSQQYWDKGSYQDFGFFQDTGYYLSGNGGAVSRLAGEAKLAGSVAGIAAVAPGMLGMTAGSAGAAALSTGGLIVGGAILAGGIGIEAANAAGHASGTVPSWDDITPSSIFKDATVNTFAYSAAGQKFKSQVTQYAKDYNVSTANAAKALGMTPGLLDYAQDTSNYGGGTFVDYMQDHKYDATDADRQFVAKFMSNKDIANTGILTSNKDTNRINDLVQLAEGYGATASEAGTAIGGLNQVYGKNLSSDIINQIGQAAQSNSMSFSSESSAALSYADNFGYLPNSAGYQNLVSKYLGIQGDANAMLQADYNSQKTGQLGSQLQAYLSNSGDMYGVGAQIVSQNNLQTQQQIGSIGTVFGNLQANGQALNQGQAQNVGKIAATLSPIQASAYSGATAQLANAFNWNASQTTQAFTDFSQMGMSNQQAAVFSSAASGNIGALSYAAWQTPGGSSNRWMDQSGNSIAETNGSQFIQNVLGHPELISALSGAGVSNANSGLQNAANLLGTSPNDPYAAAFLQGGTRQMGIVNSQTQYQDQLASIGVQVAGVQLQQNYLWGSGSYTDPSANSSWGLQNQQRQMSYNTQMADFASQQQQLQLSNNYAIASENIQQQQMTTSNAFNNWSLSASYAQSLQQRGYTQEQWGYQTQVNNLNYGYDMTNINEDIRYASGRQRKDLIRQKNEETLMFNMQTQQTATTESQQEQAWSSDDERYKKQVQYNADLQKLDQQSFDLNKKQTQDMYNLNEADYQRKVTEYKAEYDLETQIQTLDRKYQKDQLDLSLEAAGASAKAAKDQEQYNIDLTAVSNNVGDVVGKFEQLNSYDQAYATINATTEMVKQMNLTNPATVSGLQDLFKLISAVTPSSIAALLKFLTNDGK